jgi:hypothetical protein
MTSKPRRWLLCLLAFGASTALVLAADPANPPSSAAPAIPANAPNSNEAQFRAAGAELSQAMERKDWDLATVKLAEVEKLMPEDKTERLDLARFIILIGKKQYPTAYKLASQVSEAHKDNVIIQNQMAWIIAADKTVEQRDLALAETLAERANAAAARGKASFDHVGTLDTLARVRFMRGKKEDAIALQEEAVKLAEGDVKAGLQRVLDRYKKGELPN